MHPPDQPIEIPEQWPPGTIIKGDFVIERCLGAGGFGTVYLVRNRYFEAHNVIKRLHAQYAADREFVHKFLNEGRVMRRLRACPHIVDVEQMTQTEDRHLILVMEYISGGDLSKLMESRELTVEEVIEYGRQIAVGLQAAHQAGLVHRDIKPQNVLIGEDEAGRVRLKLIDFGIAADQLSRQQTSTMLSGSVGYAAPEQWLKAGKDLTGRTDLYALGATMYRMLTGQMPYPGVFDAGEFIGRTFEGPPVGVGELRAGVPAALTRLIAELLAPKVVDRPADAGLVAEWLEAMQRPVLVAAVPVPPVTIALPEPVRERTVVERPVAGAERATVLLPAVVVEDLGVVGRPLAEGGDPIASTQESRWGWEKVLGAVAVLVAVLGGAASYFWEASSRVPEKRVVENRVPTAVASRVRTNPKDGLRYVPVPAGTFQMGCSPGDGECEADEKPAHEVRISREFWLGEKGSDPDGILSGDWEGRESFRG